MANTPNYSLLKPDRTDNINDVDTSLANNFTIIDTEIKNRKDEIDGHIAGTNGQHTSEAILHADGSVKATLDNHESRLGSAETELTDHEGRLTDIETLGIDKLAPDLEGRLSTVENDVEGFLAPATMDGMSQQGYTFDEYRIGYVDNKLTPINEQLADIATQVEQQTGANDDAKMVNLIANVADRQIIRLQKGKTYSFSTSITTSKAFVLDINGATINYTGTGFWLNFNGVDRKNIVIKNGTFTGNPAINFENSYGFKIQDVMFWCINQYALQYKGVLWAHLQNVFFRRCGINVIRGVAGNTENNVLVFDNCEIQGNTDMLISPAINLDLVHQAEFRSFTVENLLQNSILYAKDCQLIKFDTPWFERVIAVDNNTDLITLDNCFNVQFSNANLGLADTNQKNRYFINAINKCGTIELKNSYAVVTTGKGFINSDSDKTTVIMDTLHCTNGAVVVKSGIPKTRNINLKANGVLGMASLSQDGLKNDFEIPWLQGVTPDVDKDFDSGETTTDSGLTGVRDTTVYLTGGASYRIDVLSTGAQKVGLINQTLVAGAVNDTYLCLVKLKANIAADIKVKFTGTAALGSDQTVPVGTKWKQFALYSSPVATAGNYYPYFTIPVQSSDFSLYIDRIIVYKLVNTGTQVIPLR